LAYVNKLTTNWSTTMAVTGPDFISLQTRDLERSAAFYEQYLGLVRSQAGPPHAVVFDTKPITFALRDLVAGVDLDAAPQPGIGVAIWLHATDTQAIHDALVADGKTIISAPIDGPAHSVGASPSLTLTVTRSPSTTVAEDELRTQLTGAGLDGGLAGFLVSLDETVATGTFSRVGDDLTRLLGRPTTGLVAGLTAEQAS
jgi:predicted enzyme related to lactoylglutathione lyase